jgi:hypothetical protein
LTARRPLLVVVGVDKAGTTTLVHALRQHREIEKCEWVDGRAEVGRSDGHRSGVVLVRHTRLFADAGAPSQVSDAAREVHVVASLRDPIGRIESMYRHRRAMGRLPVGLTLDEFVRVQLDGRAPRANDYRVVAEGRYADDLPRWQEQFGSRFRPLVFEEWVGDVLGVVKELTSWVGLDPLQSIVDEQSNESGDARFPRVSRVAHLTGRKLETLAGRVGQRERARRPVTWATQQLYVRAVTSNAPAPRLSGSLRRDLEDYYRDSDERLAGLLDRPLPWKDSPS